MIELTEQQQSELHYPEPVVIDPQTRHFSADRWRPYLFGSKKRFQEVQVQVSGSAKFGKNP